MAAILGPLISDKKLNFEQYLLNTHWYYTLQIHGITPVSMRKRIPVRESSIKKTLVETEATAEGGDLTIHFLARHMVSHISWQHGYNGCGSSTVLK